VLIFFFTLRSNERLILRALGRRSTGHVFSPLGKPK